MKGKHVLVTGGAGFIGSNLANHLTKDNDVVVVDDGYLGTAENLDSEVEFHEKSMLDEDLPTDVDCSFCIPYVGVDIGCVEHDPCGWMSMNLRETCAWLVVQLLSPWHSALG